MLDDYLMEVEINGFALREDVLSDSAVTDMIAEIEAFSQNEAACHTRDSFLSRDQPASVYAMRNILTVLPGAADIARSEAVRALVEPLLGPGCFAARGILFDKVPGANWKVPWHQDLSIAVRERIETPGFSAWSIKDGVVHVQPPASVLERMLTVRLHLDDCFVENGPVRVLPSSHMHGRLNSEQTAALRESTPEIICASPSGGALVMRPLILHASSQSSTPAHRRVIHIEYTASDTLPNGLEWHIRIETA